MNTERNIRMTGKSINVVYYTIYLITIFVVLAIFFLTYSDANIQRIDALSQLGSTLSSAYYIYLLATIPGALYLFYKYTLKLRNEKDEYVKLSKYKKAVYIRLWIIGFGLIAGMLLVFALRSQSMIFASAIAAIALYFCKPSRTKIINELDLDPDADTRTKPGEKYL